MSNRRLASLKVRDLTLSGAPKRKFMPTIPVRAKDKVKEEPQNASTSSPIPSPATPGTSKQGAGRGQAERGRGDRGRGRGKREVIQSESIFDKGMAATMKNRGGWGGGGGGGGYDREAAVASRQTIKRERRSSADTKKALDSLLRDDFIDDGVDGGKGAMNPTTLPFQQIIKKEVKPKVKGEPPKGIKTEPGVAVKQEPGLDEVDATSVTSSISSIDPAVDPDNPDTPAQLFLSHAQSQGSKLILLQLPDTLPGDPPARENPVSGSSAALAAMDDEDLTPDQLLAKQLGLCNLRDFDEGKIGKIQILRSGKTRLVIGNTKLDIFMGTPNSCLQDLASIRIEDPQSTDIGGHISMLGHVDHKLIVVPDLESMLS